MEIDKGEGRRHGSLEAATIGGEEKGSKIKESQSADGKSHRLGRRDKQNLKRKKGLPRRRMCEKELAEKEKNKLFHESKRRGI